MRPFGTCTSDGPADFTGRLSQPPIDPSARLDGIKSYHVVKFEKDGRGVDRLIAENLRRRGYQVTEGPTPAGGVDAVVTYMDKWFWDITMYMLELAIQIRDPNRRPARWTPPMSRTPT